MLDFCPLNKWTVHVIPITELEIKYTGTSQIYSNAKKNLVHLCYKFLCLNSKGGLSHSDLIQIFLRPYS